MITDARFSGVSTGACIGHVAPEALAGGPIGQRARRRPDRDRDRPRTLEGSLNFVGEAGVDAGVEAGTRMLERRRAAPDLAPDPKLPDDTRLWAALQDVSGGTWGGSVYDVDAILEVIAAGKRAMSKC